MKLFRSLYLTNRLFLLLTANILLFVVGYFFVFFFLLGQLTLLLILAFLFADIVLLYRGQSDVVAQRNVPQRLSNGDANSVSITISNSYPMMVRAILIDEVPFQFQLRNFRLTSHIPAKKQAHLHYQLTPKERGNYNFGKINIFARSILELAERRFISGESVTVPVYPSFLQMRKFEIYTVANRLSDLGIKNIRRIGHSMEFDRIRSYVPGDDIRTINWKSTAKHSNLMVNLYEDQQSQQVYNLIDRGRVMKMPFEGMTLLDYAINSSLIISSVTLNKKDMSGLLTFSDTIQDVVPATRRPNQINYILQALYGVNVDFHESDFEKLYYSVKRIITTRSLLFLYTNIDSMSSLKRRLPYLKKMADAHLLVVVIFENTALDELLAEPVEKLNDAYNKTIAEKFKMEKIEIISALEQNGIHTILTTPQKLTIQAINKYLELKARNLV